MEETLHGSEGGNPVLPPSDVNLPDSAPTAFCCPFAKKKCSYRKKGS
jgi:hypothetical protein